MSKFLVLNENTGKLYKREYSRTELKFDTKQEAERFIKDLQNEVACSIPKTVLEIRDLSVKENQTEKKIQKLQAQHAEIVKQPYIDVYKMVHALERRIENAVSVKNVCIYNQQTLKKLLERQEIILRSKFKVVVPTFV